MNRLQVQDGCFIHPDTYEPVASIQVVITDSGKPLNKPHDA